MQQTAKGRVMLTISPGKVVYVIERARQFDVKDVVTDPGESSNMADDGMIEVLEDHPDDPAEEELRAFIDGLNDDEKVDLIALMWLGRDDYEADDWASVREEAQANFDRRSTVRYLAGTPLLADYLEVALDTLGYPVSDLESEEM
jgi:hypothetical protein